MEKKNDKTVQSNEVMELTLDQMDKVSGGILNIASTNYTFDPEEAEPSFPNPFDHPDTLEIVTMD